jgi:RNA polymerase sigma-70 factor (ECF subfamily)
MAVAPGISPLRPAVRGRPARGRPRPDRAHGTELPARSRLPHPRPARGGAASAALTPGALLDHDSRRWCRRLRPDAPDREAAIAELHALLLSAAGFEVRRRAASLPHLRGGELDDIAAQSADDALVAVLAKLDGFRGASRFTTWAYKFALLEAATAMRRRAWQGHEIPVVDEHWSLLAHAGPSPVAQAETSQLLRAIAAAIEAELTPHQREVLVMLAVDGVPIDVLAHRLSTTRGALYKTLHDARRKLRRHLAADGVMTEGERG